jgi:hypothetical protein
MARILMCIPVALGYARVEFQMATLGTILDLRTHGHEVVVDLDESGSIVRSRNLGAAKVLLDKEYTHLGFLDSDMSWTEFDAFRRMVDCNRGVVCGMYTTKWKEPRLVMTAYEDRVQDMVPDGDGLVRIKRAPTGFMVIQREVLETIAEERPDLKINFNSVVHRPEGEFIEPGQYLMFDARRSNTDNHYISDDYGFSETWTELGGNLWVYPYVTIRHHWMTSHELNFGEMLKALGVQGLKAPGEGERNIHLA